MAARAETRPGSSPHSLPESGVGTIAPSEANFNPSAVADEVAEGITCSMFDNVLNSEGNVGITAEQVQALGTENAYLKMQNEQLQAELASARSEKEEIDSRHRAAQGTLDDRTKQADVLDQQTRSVRKELDAAQSQLTTSEQRRAQLEEDLASSRRDLTASQSELVSLRQKLELAGDKGALPQPVAAGPALVGGSGREQSSKWNATPCASMCPGWSTS